MKWLEQEIKKYHFGNFFFVRETDSWRWEQHPNYEKLTEKTEMKQAANVRIGQKRKKIYVNARE